MSERIAIVGAACRYPDAASVAELWENVLARRQAFRRIPEARLRLDDYWSADEAAPDKTYSARAAVLTGYRFDRVAFRVSREAFESTDVAHWLALDVTAAAIADAALELPADTTGVVIGNTLTGDASRASALRLRWPYVRRTVAASLAAEGWTDEHLSAFLGVLESRFKAPFAPVNEDTLAGGLANTIAGRICNYFGFHGGGYTVDGACASSLLAVTQACASLARGDLDAAIAGGVDLSLDPFELVGFAKCTALARDRMRVFDRRAAGFLPGEGCGMVVLMRERDALRDGRRIYATIGGWGISSDGHGGMTRPEVEGQKLAIGRALASAAIDPSMVRLFEAHGTGTATGDATEIAALLSFARGDDEPHYVGSVKANIGHTKAAAGIAGLLKAMMAVHRGIIPPATGCDEPRAELAGDGARLRVARRPLRWSEDTRRAGVSAFGFGGINTHVVLESAAPAPPLTARERKLGASAQDAEVFLFAARTRDELLAQVRAVGARAGELSFAEMVDLAAELRRGVVARDFRLAIVAASPEELQQRANDAVEGKRERLESTYSGAGSAAPRIAFLFSGQASPVRRDADAWSVRFPDLALDRLFDRANASCREGTALAQPSIVASSLAGLRVLARLGITAGCAAGHSLGELAALAWAGAFTEEQVLALAAERGSLMQAVAGDGTMLALTCSPSAARELAGMATIAAFNARDQVVLSGSRATLEQAAQRARARGIATHFVDVAVAFHSEAMTPVAAPLEALVRAMRPAPLERNVISTTSGALLDRRCDVATLLARQLTAPVRFTDAIAELEAEADLLIEVGPGALLAGLARRSTTKLVLPIDACGPQLAPLLETFAAAFAAGVDVDVDVLFADRFAKRFDLQAPLVVLESPCERAADHEVPRFLGAPRSSSEDAAAAPEELPGTPRNPEGGADAAELLRTAVAARLELPPSAVPMESRMLSDLHLSSITVARILGEVARAAGAPPLVDATSYANATLAEAGAVIEASRGAAAVQEPAVDGIGDWVRPFGIERVPVALRKRRTAGRRVTVRLRARDEAAIATLLDAAKQLEAGDRLVIAQECAGGAAFARSLFLERLDVSVRVVNVPSLEAFAAVIDDEGEGEGDFCEAFYDASGVRTEPRVRLHRPRPPRPVLAKGQTLLVTGGGKGIAVEAALELARTRGVRLAILGRSDPARDTELANNLARMRAAGVDVRYAVADVTDLEAVARAVAWLGPVDAILHAAGTNEPAAIASLTLDDVRRAVAPKVAGLRNVVAACDPARLGLVAAFGSVIARCGMHGEAHYALANEWLALELEELARAHPSIRTLCLEWSVWSGLGMGERLGRVEALRRQGVTPIDPEEAVRLASALVDEAEGAVIACGRLGEPPTLTFDGTDAPPLRFLELARRITPGVELITDAEISSRNDPYVDDHTYRGEPLFPAVFMLEAMAQAATTLAGAVPRRVEGIDLRRPVVAPSAIRIAALRNGDVVETAIRCAATEYRADHARARWVPRVPRSSSEFLGDRASILRATEAPVRGNRVPRGTEEFVPRGTEELRRTEELVRGTTELVTSVYDTLLFHGPRFRRVAAYRVLAAGECVVEIAAGGERPFHRFLPQRLILGDPIARDAAIHALQACIPQATVLPVAVASIDFLEPLPQETLLVSARETRREPDALTWDLELTTLAGRVVERWSGLRLQIVARRESFDDIPSALWGPLLERELGPGAPRIAVAHGSSDAVLQSIASVVPNRRSDGRPYVPGAARPYASASHAGLLTLAVTDARAAGCDVETAGEDAVVAVADTTGAPLARVVARESGEPDHVAATRVWTAGEAMKKATGNAAAPLVLDRVGERRRVAFSAGEFRVETFAIAGHVVAIAFHN